MSKSQTQLTIKNKNKDKENKEKIKKTHVTSIDVYTDGSFKRKSNGDFYGCGYGIYFPNEELKNVSYPFTHGEITINRAELFAIYQAILRVIKYLTFDLVNIYTDSDYSYKSLTIWINEWKQNNWKTAKRKPVDNQDLIRKIDKYLQRYRGKINMQWIPSKSKGNKEADKLAKDGSAKYYQLYGHLKLIV